MRNGNLSDLTRPRRCELMTTPEAIPVPTATYRQEGRRTPHRASARAPERTSCPRGVKESSASESFSLKGASFQPRLAEKIPIPCSSSIIPGTHTPTGASTEASRRVRARRTTAETTSSAPVWGVATASEEVITVPRVSASTPLMVVPPTSIPMASFWSELLT